MEGLNGFFAGLEAYGAVPEAIEDHIVYQVEAVDGCFAGQLIETAVAVGELGRWPLVPPHWIYLSDKVMFSATNTQPCSMSGWVGHSRQIVGWGADPDPVAGWMAHVRGVIGEAR